MIDDDDDDPTVDPPQRHFRCRKCNREVVLKQQRDRVSGVVLLAFNCPQHGTLQRREVESGYLYRKGTR